MTVELVCPRCSTRHHEPEDTVRSAYCSDACFRANLGYDNPDYQASPGPPRHDGVTITCPVDGRRFTPTGRQKFCSPACQAAAYRRRRDAHHTTITVPRAQPRRPITVYECDGCGDRALAEQHCPGVQHMDAPGRPRRILPHLRPAGHRERTALPGRRPLTAT